MKILSSKLREDIYNIFDSVDNESLEGSGKYIIKCFSAFDHWLSEEETDRHIFFYEHALEKLNSVKSKQYFIYHDRLINFYTAVFNKMKVYGYMFGERGPSQLIEFDSIEEYKSHVLASVREQLFLKIIIPEISIIIDGGYDLTHIIYVLKENKEFNIISKIIAENGLFILP